MKHQEKYKNDYSMRNDCSVRNDYLIRNDHSIRNDYSVIVCIMKVRDNLSTEDWYKVDNVAKVFLASFGRRDTRSLRVSCTLTEKVDTEKLQCALDKTVKSRPQFHLRIRRGFFWHYMEETDVMPVVVEETQRPCPILYGPDYKGILHYQVSYYGNRINLDLFHALSDGTGALEFLNILVLNYLKLTHPGELDHLAQGSGASAGELNQNSFTQFYEKNGVSLDIPNPKKAYHIRGRRLPYDQMQFLEVHMNKDDILKESKELHVSLTSLVGAKLMMALKNDMPLLKRKQPITISVPVNLRNFYPSQTARNFFNSVSVSHVFDGKETLEDLAKEFDTSLKGSLDIEKIKLQMERYQLLERLIVVRVVPLLLKQPVVRYFSNKENKSVSAVISNLGPMKPLEQMQPYIEGYAAYCSHMEPFVTVLSYGEEIVLGVSYTYQNTGVLKSFVRSLCKNPEAVKVYATEVIH